MKFETDIKLHNLSGHNAKYTPILLKKLDYITTLSYRLYINIYNPKCYSF